MDKQEEHLREMEGTKMALIKAEIMFCLSYFGNGLNADELAKQCEAMKYELSMMRMLEEGELDFDNEKRVYVLTEKGRKAAKDLYGLHADSVVSSTRGDKNGK